MAAGGHLEKVDMTS